MTNPKSKPREFWTDGVQIRSCSEWTYDELLTEWSSGFYAVIEHSAYAELQAEVERLKFENERLKSEFKAYEAYRGQLEALTKEADALAEALDKAAIEARDHKEAGYRRLDILAIARVALGRWRKFKGEK